MVPYFYKWRKCVLILDTSNYVVIESTKSECNRNTNLSCAVRVIIKKISFSLVPQQGHLHQHFVVLGCIIQRPSAFFVGFVGVSPFLQQKIHRVFVALLGCKDQRRPSPFTCFIDFSPIRQQESNHLFVAINGGNHNMSIAVLVLLVGVSPLPQQEIHHGRDALVAGKNVVFYAPRTY